jgi:hypothetical protein
MNIYDTRDIVRYDRVSTYSTQQFPYRSDELTGPDLAEVMLSRWHADYKSRQVQVIITHGDSMWTNVEYIRSEDVGDFGMQRYIVRLADGTEHMVSQDRIRLRPTEPLAQ